MPQNQSPSPSPPPEPPLEPAGIWLEKNAKWHVPEYKPPSRRRSSSEVPYKHLEFEFVCLNAPVMAFHDAEKAKRFINTLEGVLHNTPLRATPEGNGNHSPSMVRYLFAKLFHPYCTQEDGIPKDMWRELSNEIVCNRLIHEALLHVLKAVLHRLLGKNIYTATEPLHPDAQPGRFDDTTTATLKKKIDFAVFWEGLDGKDIALFLVEGKTPLVLRSLGILLAEDPIRINFKEQSSPGEKILHKLIYYMRLRKLDRLVITSFREAYILELHETESGMGFLSYSSKIEVDQKSDLFRAMLGLTLVELGIGHFDPFNAKAAYESYRESLKAATAERAERRAERRGSPPGSSGGGRSSGSGGKRGGTSKEGSSGGIGNTTKSTSKRGAKLTHEETDGGLTATNDANEIASPRVTRSMSKSLMKLEREETVESMTSVKPGVESLHIIGPGIDLMVDRDSVSPFPKLPTSARVPCLKVVGKLECLNGYVFEAVLQDLDGSDSVSEPVRPAFVVKVVDVSQLSYDEYRNTLEELVKEYKTYYLLALAKQSGRFNNVIQKFTPICYGLYLTKGGSGDVFALVMEHVGDVELAEYMTWSGSDKVGLMQSLLALHSIGLKHGDPDERNVGSDRDGVDVTYRFFDFGCSTWHKCHGITDCEELKQQIRMLYDTQEPPLDPLLLQERTIREYALPFCNLEDVVDGMGLFETERPVLRLTTLGDQYYKDFFQSQN